MRTLKLISIVATLLLTACVTTTGGPGNVISDYGSYVGALGRRPGPHAGVDFGRPRNTPILASADGVVVHVGNSRKGGCGSGISLHHESYKLYTTYCHMEETKAELGKSVKRGEVIGLVGNTGQAAVTHVHLEVCTDKCPYGHADGDLKDTESPIKYLVGCYDSTKSYATDKLVLTIPVACTDETK